MKDYIIKTLNGMAYGLFATLIVGVIFQQIGDIFKIEFLSTDLYSLLSSLMGVGIAVGIGLVLKKDGLLLITIGIIGAISTGFKVTTNPLLIEVVSGPGNPLTAYFVTIFSIIILENILKKQTPVDIIIVPLLAITVAVIFTLVLSLPLDLLNKAISDGITLATTFAPFIMVIVIAVVMGMLLTAPISSAAIAFILFHSSTGTVSGSAIGIAAGASVVGTSIQMIGFAIQSRRDNNLGSVISIGIGTSMLQFKNIVKKPIIWLPTILSSAIVAPIVYLIGFESNYVGAGMGTSGLVGPLQSLKTMDYNFISIISILIIVIFGGLLVYIFDRIMYKMGYIEKGDLSLDDKLE